MGKGDIKTKKGKRSAGSYGVSRQRKKVVVEVKPKAKKKATTTAKKAEPKKKETTAKKAPAKKTAAVKKEDK